MATGITFKLAQPDKIIKSGQASGVIIPAYEDSLTIIEGRAPSMILLKNGIVRILDNSGNPAENYYVKGGIADIFENICVVSSETIIDRKSITIVQAEDKLKNILEKNSEQTREQNSNENINEEYAISGKKYENEVSDQIRDEEMPVEDVMEDFEKNKSKKTSPIKIGLKSELLKNNDEVFYQMILENLRAFK